MENESNVLLGNYPPGDSTRRRDRTIVVYRRTIKEGQRANARWNSYGTFSWKYTLFTLYYIIARGQFVSTFDVTGCGEVFARGQHSWLFIRSVF